MAMNYEAAMIVVSRPQFFSVDDRFAAAEFIVKAACPPQHIHCDHAANQRKAENVADVAFEAIRWQNRWPGEPA